MDNQTKSGFSVEASEEELRNISERHRGQKGNTIAVLQDIEEEFGYIPEEAIAWVSERLGIPESTFFGVATFYAQFHLKPRGKNIVTVCCGTACHVKGAEKLLTKAQTELGLDGDRDTTLDLKFSLEKVACLGTCSMAPAVLINKKMHGAMKPETLAREIKKIKKAGKSED